MYQKQRFEKDWINLKQKRMFKNNSFVFVFEKMKKKLQNFVD